MKLVLFVLFYYAGNGGMAQVKTAEMYLWDKSNPDSQYMMLDDCETYAREMRAASAATSSAHGYFRCVPMYQVTEE